MRKRLIGKAFAVAMSGAMVFTASPVTANIFNVASIVKAAEADQAESYHYCYVGLTWTEYWENEGVYNATNTNSVDTLDHHNETDQGGYDVVTRATMNHGVSRASFQCMFTLHVKDAEGNKKSIDIASFKEGSSLNTDFVLNGTDGKEYKVHNNSRDKSNDLTSIVVSTGSDSYTFENYEIKGTKYVPVKVSNDDWAAFSKQYEGKIVENGTSFTCGSEGEGNVKQQTYTASVDASTQGLKTATKNSDGTFSFSKRVNNGTTSGIEGQSLKTATDVTPVVCDNSKTGSYGEFLRVDITGNGYGDLGANMQSVEWTYYGNDATRTTALRTFGTKFAADNWMHSKAGVQLGLTDSIRCKLPENTDGTGYWSLTIHALGYNDYTYDFIVKESNINHWNPATEAHINDLKALVNEADALTNTKNDYCTGSERDNAFDLLSTELDETKELLNKDNLYDSEATGQKAHLEEAIAKVKTLKKHDLETITTPATTTKEGSVVVKCKNCGEIISTKTLEKLKESATTTATKPAATTTVTNKTQVKAPAKTTVKLSKAKKTSIKVSWKKISGVAAYQIQYSTSKNFKKAKTVKVSAKSTSKVLKKLKKNKKYYVRVRSYKVTKVNNKSKNVYSAWSAKKALKTKKK